MNEASFKETPKLKYKICHAKIEGTTPNETTSDRESRSFPIAELTFNARAIIPSNKSNTALIKMQHAGSILNFVGFEAINTMATQPEKRLSSVMVLGICFAISFTKKNYFSFSSFSFTGFGSASVLFFLFLPILPNWNNKEKRRVFSNGLRA